MKQVSLASLLLALESGARPKGGATSDTGEIPSVGAEHLADDGGFKFDRMKRVPRSFFESMRSGKISPEDILIVKDGATTGKTSFVTNQFPFSDAAVNEHVFRLCIDGSKACPRYVFHFLRSPQGQAGVMSDFHGATVGGISRGFATKTVVPSPEVGEQSRIAAILDQADALRAKRRAALAQLDNLTQSIFIEMFGDPVTNPKGWPRVRFASLLENIDSGWSPVCMDRAAQGDEWGVLKLGAVTSCAYKDWENKALPDGVAFDSKIEVRPGDLLFSRKNTYNLVAAFVLVNATRERLMLSDLIFRFRLNSDAKVEKRYLQSLLVFPTKRSEVQKLAGGSSGSMPNISKGRLLELDIELPPLSLQQIYSTRIQSIEALKATNRTALAELDTLFASLQHRAFRGDL